MLIGFGRIGTGISVAVASLHAETTIEVCSETQLKAIFYQHEHVFYVISLTGIQDDGPFPPSTEYRPLVRTAEFAPAMQLQTHSWSSLSCYLATKSVTLAQLMVRTVIRAPSLTIPLRFNLSDS